MNQDQNLTKAFEKITPELIRDTLRLLNNRIPSGEVFQDLVDKTNPTLAVMVVKMIELSFQDKKDFN